MTLTRVVHAKRDRFDVYIGRPSRWGNPFGTAESAKRSKYPLTVVAYPLAAYEAHVLASPALMAALPSLRGKVLGCWCKPKPCHGDVLARLADALP